MELFALGPIIYGIHFGFFYVVCSIGKQWDEAYWGFHLVSFVDYDPYICMFLFDEMTYQLYKAYVFDR